MIVGKVSTVARSMDPPSVREISSFHPVVLISSFLPVSLSLLLYQGFSQPNFPRGYAYLWLDPHSLHAFRCLVCAMDFELAVRRMSGFPRVPLLSNGIHHLLVSPLLCVSCACFLFVIHSRFRKETNVNMRRGMPLLLVTAKLYFPAHLCLR